MKSFNIAGPCRPERHYMIRPDDRLVGIERLIEDQAYFVVHAPRQSGKTTTLDALARRITAEGRYAALHFSCETARAFAEVGPAERRIWLAVVDGAQAALPSDLRPPPLAEATEGGFLSVQLRRWAESCPRPLVLFVDEIDALEGAPLKSVLSQLRDGFPHRPERFPWSVVLCGMKDVRDDKLVSGGGPPRTGSSSPFNIKETSLRLANFTREQLTELYLQHTAATGQIWQPDAIERAWTYSQGQPWLTNALAREVVREIAVPLDQPITADHLDQAMERLILARATHLDGAAFRSLLGRLQEDRVRRVLEPVLAGELIDISPYDDQYVLDLGLISATVPPQIANPLYREVISRVLAGKAEMAISAEVPRYLLPSGRLDFPVLMAGFIEFWTEHGDLLVTRMPYPEAAPMLVLMAWLHRAVNGQGHIDARTHIHPATTPSGRSVQVLRA